jgi:serine/threonine protein kinase
MIGEGTYGIVFFAKDKNTNEQLAIKKMKVLDNQDGFPMTSLREVKILKMLSSHPNIVSLREVVVGLKAESVFLVFEYCDIDLYKLLNQMIIDKSCFSEAEIKCLSLQLIKGVMHS